MWIKAIILGVIEGLTEFLPVSSTGHLILANGYFDFEGPFANLFAIVIQVGAIVAVLIFFREKLFPKFTNLKELKPYINLWTKVVIGILPAAIIGIPLEDKIEELLFKPSVVAVALVVGAIMLLWAEKRLKTVKVESESLITYKQAFLVGIFQCMALVPGMSRSGSTIIGGLVLGFSRAVAAEFSFFLAIPTIIGAGFIKLIKTDYVMTQNELFLLLLGTFVSFVVAYAVIAVFMNYIKKHDLKLFAYYRIVLGLGIIIMLFMN